MLIWKLNEQLEGSCFKLLYLQAVTWSCLTFLHYSSPCNGNRLSGDWNCSISSGNRPWNKSSRTFPSHINFRLQSDNCDKMFCTWYPTFIFISFPCNRLYIKYSFKKQENGTTGLAETVVLLNWQRETSIKTRSIPPYVTVLPPACAGLKDKTVTTTAFLASLSVRQCFLSAGLHFRSHERIPCNFIRLPR